jgi:methyl-accepting chemotaxis protein
MFTNLTLKTKFIALESVSFSMFLAMSIFGLVQLSGAVADEEESFSRLTGEVEVAMMVDDMSVAFLKEVKLAKDVWLRGADSGKLKKYRGEFIEQQLAFDHGLDKAAAKMKSLDAGRAGRAGREWSGYLTKLGVLRDTHRVVSNKYLSQIDGHTNYMDSDAKVAGIDRELSKELSVLREDMTAYVFASTAEKIAFAKAGFYERRHFIIVWVILSLSISFILATVIIRQITRQLGGDPKEVAEVVNTMAAGDFSKRPLKQAIPNSLLANAYHMQDRLREMIAKVKGHANQVGDMAHSLAMSSQQIAERVNHESDAVSSMAASIEELSVTTSQISEQGAGAKRTANSSRSSAEQGAQVVNNTVAGLLATAEEIETASVEVSRLGEDASRISSVVKVIKEIADQTNLLALNAAIEAARAGEQGRGFAVVADEVRKLAERTAGATNEINQMSSKIGNVAAHALSGMDKVVCTTRQGVTDAESAQRSIAQIQQSFTEVANVIDNISVALAEQNASAALLAGSTEQISAMAEENAGAARNLFVLSRSLESKASEVQSAVEVFRV